MRDIERESSTTTAFVSQQTKSVTLSLRLDLQFPFDVPVDLLNSVWVVRPERVPYVWLIFYREECSVRCRRSIGHKNDKPRVPELLVPPAVDCQFVLGGWRPVRDPVHMGVNAAVTKSFVDLPRTSLVVDT